MTQGQKFINEESKKRLCSAMSIAAWCDLKSKIDILKLHDMWPNSKCKCQN